MRRWLVTGACGQLGAHVMAAVGRQAVEDQVVGAGRRRCTEHGDVRACDVTDAAALARLLDEVRPTHVVHCAGVSSPAAVQLHPGETRSAALAVTRALAQYAARSGTWLLLPSTDFMWNGRHVGRYGEHHVPSPLTAYGLIKLSCERAVLGAEAGCVARLSLVYGLPLCRRRTTWSRLLAALRSGVEVPVVVDEVRTPVAVQDAADVVVGLGLMEHRGLVHVASPDATTPQEAVLHVARLMGVRPALRPVMRAQLDGGALRPRNAALDASLLRSLLPGTSPRSFFDLELLQR